MGPPAARARPNSGLAAYAGSGNAVAGEVGLAVGYYQRLGSTPWYLVPRLAGGYSRWFPTPDGRLAWGAGLMVVRGHVHRALLSLHYGVVAYEAVGLHGTVFDWNPVNGPQVGLGYELNRDAFLFQIVPALSYQLEGLDERKLRLGLSLVAGWKFW